MNKLSELSKSERTRKFIIEKTARIFNIKGYAGTSISDLTNATSLTKGSVYGNFRNKDEIALAVFKYNIGQISSAFADGVEQASAYINKLLAYPRVYRKIFKDVMSNGGCPLLNTLVESDDTHPELKKAALDALESWRRGISSLIKAGKSSGEIAANVDENRAAENIISLFEGGGIMAKSTGRESFIINALEQIEDIIIAMKA
jgi:AcrR family transcriptional regulator